MAYGYLTPYRRRGLQTSGSQQSGGSLFDLHRQMNSLFEDLVDPGADSGSFARSGSHPAMDVHQEEDRIEITAELPGVKEEDIDLTVEDGVLILSGEKRSSRSDDQQGYSERSYGKFERRVTLPSNIDEDEIGANFEQGVLTVTLPKAEKQRGRKITLGTAKSRSDRRSEAALIEQRDRGSGKDSDTGEMSANNDKARTSEDA